MENLYENFKKYANKAYNQVAPLIPFSNANQYNFNPNSNLYQNTKELNMQNDADILNQQMANYRANQNGTFMLNALAKSDEQKQKDNIDFDNKFIDLVTAKGYTPHKAIDKDGKARYAIGKDGVFKEIKPSFLNDLKANSYEMLGSLAGVATALPHPLAKTAGVAGKILTPMVGSAVGSGAGAMADTYLNNKSVGEKTTAEQLANSFTGGANNDILGAGLATAITSKPAINIAKGTLKAPLEVLDKGLTGVGARHIMSQNIGGAQAALKANLGGEYEARNALDSAKDALGADLDNFVSKDLKTINKTSDNRYIQKGIDIANSAINKANETLKGLNIGKADAELLLSALGHENGVKNILDAVANNPQSAQKITEISSNLNKSFAGSINEQLAKFETQTPKDSFKNSFNQVKQDYADTKDFLVKNSNYQSDFKDLNENIATILNDTQNINTRGIFNALNGGGNLENLLNAKNAINEQLSYIMRADFKSSSDFINQKALSEAKSLIDNEINTALKNDENLINLYKSANGDYATMKNIVDSNLMSQISRDGKTSLEALNAMIKSNENINGVTLNDFLSSLGAKDRAIAEANIIKGLMEKNSVNGVVDFRALNQSLNSLDFGSKFAKELRSQILNRQALLNNTSDILNALGNKVVKSKSMSQGISTDPLKRAETMRANLIIEKIKPLIPKLGNNEALKLHLNKAILNANGDFKLAIKNIDNIPDGNLPTPTRNLLNEFKEAVKEIEKQVVKADNQPNLAQNSIKGDGFVISGNGVEPKSDLNVKISVDEWVKELAGINPNKQIIADLEHLYEKHKELFSKPSEVFKLIKAVKDNPTFFYTNNQPNIALIGSILENGKLGKIGIQKDFNSDNLQVRHATYSSNAKKENERLLKRNSYPVGSPTPTQLTFGKTAEPTANGAKALLGKKDGAIAWTPAPATTRPNNGVEGEIIKNRTNAQTIPNQTIKQAETTVKAEPISQATPNLTRDGVVSEMDARNLAKNISLNKDIAIQLQPKADLLKLVKDFSNVIKTPIFESKISIDKLLNHLADKTDADKRLEYLNLIKPTLENPLFITRENNRYRFVKTFIDSDKITKFLSVIENDKGEFLGITATPIKNTDLKNLLKGNIVWGGDTLSTLSTPQIAKQEVEAISETIPNQSIKEAETTAKETTQEPQATTAKEPKAEPIATAAKNPTAEQPKWANKFKTKMAKMGQEYNDEKIANLANWHKDSHAVTKESDGSPKVFYHGTNAKFNAFDIDKSKGGWLGKSFYFTDSKGKAKGYGKNVISTYLNLKNPYISKANDHYKFINEVKEQFGVKENYGEFNPAQVLKQHGYDGVVYKDWDDEVGTIYTAFSPNQIKSISNKGTFNPNSKMMDGFSTMAIQKAILHLGSGGIGGVMNANAEQDPNKKAEAFVKGFLLGAGGSVGAIKMLENSAKLAPQLAQTSQRLAKDLPMILNDRPDIVGKALGRTPKENYNYIFGGQNAIGANKAKLKTAQEMAKNGADESEIWAKTGWYKDIDKKWKFEINPKGGELGITALKKATPNKLGDILKDDELFKAYPQVKDLSILPTKTKDGANAAYQEAEVFGLRRKAILFNDDYLQNATNDEIRSTLYHEIQHAIQSIEGFAPGGSTQNLSYQEYKNLAGESEARNVEKRLNRTYSKDDAIDGEFNRLWIKYLDNPKTEKLRQKRWELIKAGKRDEAIKITKEEDQTEEFLKSQAVKNVEGFSNYSPHPFKTLDINPNDRIVKYGSGMSVSANPRQKAGQYAKWLSQADKIAPQALDELYKAYDKAKKDLKPKK